MFEFKTSMHAIPASQLYLYYFVLFLLYLFFLRGLKPTLLTASIMLLFNQGFLLLIDDQGRPVKVLFILLTLILLFRGRFSGFTKRDKRVLLYAFLFMLLFFTNYIHSGVSLLWGAYQYYKYFIPVAMYFGIKGLKLKNEDLFYYSDLIIKLMWFQIVFSVVKLIILGFRENITGSIANLGGSVGITFAISTAILYWQLRGKEINGRDWWFMLLVLIPPVASNKRAIWLLYPIIIALLLTRQINIKTLRKVSYGLFLIPVLFYVGLRLNPSFNPEKKLWGSFDPAFAMNFTLSYSGVSENKAQSDLARGRLGSTEMILYNVARDPFSVQSLIGFPRSRSGRVDYEEIDPTEFGLMPGTMISGLGSTIMSSGWPGTLLLLLLYGSMIAAVPDKRTRFVLMFFLLWDTIFYSGSVINNTTHSLIFILTVVFSQREFQFSAISAKKRQGDPKLHYKER